MASLFTQHVKYREIAYISPHIIHSVLKLAFIRDLGIKISYMLCFSHSVYLDFYLFYVFIYLFLNKKFVQLGYTWHGLMQR